MGVTLSTWKAIGYDKDGDGRITQNDLDRMTEEDLYTRILKPHFWDLWKADRIDNQSVANLLVDWVWGSGSWGIVIPQRILNVKADGVVGNVTLSALNAAIQKELFKSIWYERKIYLLNLVVKDPTQKVFLKGWLNRLNDMKYED